jgi:UDP-N-acetylmuramoyl-L-alanyl-D-glutamate--2,6-diaminopimelate ligase
MNKEFNRLLEEGLIGRDNLRIDSRKCEKGDIFFALKGTACDGHDYIGEALAKGASRAICAHEMPGLSGDDQKKVITVKNTGEALAYAVKKVFGDPSGKLKVYGVTGTNGKTTTVFLIESLLTCAGKPTGLISTVFTKTKGSALNRSSMTTPDPVTLNRLLSEMVSDAKKAAALEVSSHALAQDRISGIGLDSAVFTNITPEHLDYHGNMETYFQDKSRIFKNLKPDGIGVINIDDPMLKRHKAHLGVPRLITFGLAPEADVRAENIVLKNGALVFDLIIKSLGRENIRARLIGTHNVYNMMAASAALIVSGLDLGQIKEGLESASTPPGRIDPVPGEAPFKVFVDYAHTPNALENVLQCLRACTEKKLICVFGCGGDRDKTKRPVMGKIALEICDSVILTNDNPRTEDPGRIVRQIEKGMPDKTKYCIIVQRREAIRKAIETAQEGDVIVIAGKGHEDYQIIGDKVIHFDDKEVAGEILSELGYG